MVTHGPAPSGDAAPPELNVVGNHYVYWNRSADRLQQAAEFICVAPRYAACRPDDCLHPQCCAAISWTEFIEPRHQGARTVPDVDGEVSLSVVYRGEVQVLWMHTDDWRCEDCDDPMELDRDGRCHRCWELLVFGPEAGASPPPMLESPYWPTSPYGVVRP